MQACPTPCPGFLQLSTEIIQQALIHCHPRDVAAFAQTCRAARLLVYHSADHFLWRELFLAYPFDDPRPAPRTPHGATYTHTDERARAAFDWRGALQRRVHAELVARAPRAPPAMQTAALETLLAAVQSAPPVVHGARRVRSRTLLWAMDVLESTRLLAVPAFGPTNTSQSLARLRAYLALTLDCDDGDGGSGAGDGDGDDTSEGGDGGMWRTPWMQALRARSRCCVYDQRNYRPDNDWGPLAAGGRVDWVHVEAIVNVVLANLAELPAHAADARPPCGLEATRAYSAPGATACAPGDWAGVEGNWRRFVSFLDYRDLSDFNEVVRNDPTADRSFFDRSALFGELTLQAWTRLRLIDPKDVPAIYTLDRFPEPSDPRYPTLYFAGGSTGLYSNEAVLVGSAAMSDEGVVRWRFVSVYGGQVRWSSEGVQLGGIASAAGVVGAWTGGHHEHADPVGPFWFWKVSDDSVDSLTVHPPRLSWT